MIVVDTSVWIDFLEARETSFDIHLTELIQRGEALALTDLIYCEVLQGISEDAEFRRVRSILQSYPILRMRGLATFESSTPQAYTVTAADRALQFARQWTV